MVLNTTGSSRVDKVARWFDWSQLTLTASQARSGWKARHHGGTQFSPDVASSSGYARCRTILRAQRIGLRSKISPGTTVIALYMLAARRLPCLLETSPK